MSGSGCHETEDSVDEAPVAIEEGTACIDEMLQHGPDVRECDGITDEWCQSLGATVL
jgi:hypothetical protein